MNAHAPPAIIQGGMGIGVSDWKLARAVSLCGQMGVVSGTAIDSVLARRLQDGDHGGHMRRAMEHFPLPQAAAGMLRRHFKPGGRAPGEPYSLLPMHQQVLDRARQQITMLASFVEVHLAKHGHMGPVGINLLTKAQMPNLASLYGAMLAGVDYVLMGAGIPREIPGALDALAEHRPTSLRLEVEGGSGGPPEHLTLDPGEHFESKPAALRRPRFLPIIASNSLASLLARKGSGRVDGFVIEGPTAGGHNAPPRGEAPLNERGEPLYGERDVVNLSRIRELGLPFWLAGGAGCPTRYREARELGAAGIQVGTLFAYCEESGLTEPLKRSVLEHAVRGEVDVSTDPVASPTGYPFKVVRWPGDPAQGKQRARVCDLGYLRTAYRRPDGRIGYRCAGEPVDQYVEKGGEELNTYGRRCLCNALFANIGLAQELAGGGVEPPLLTSGDDLRSIGTFLAGRTRYTAADVVRYLLGDAPVPALGV
jgi:NAD(P)H-dependent flavin oxidoreductase YrpB (nitropropane dioxygenase family)